MRYVILALALVLGGCAGGEPERVAVRGTVLLDGAPLEKGTIVFIPEGETRGPKASGTISGGIFEIDESSGPVVGLQRVKIRSEPQLGFSVDDPEAFRRQPSPDLPADPIPARYNDESTLVVRTAADGENKFDFQIDTSSENSE